MAKAESKSPESPGQSTPTTLESPTPGTLPLGQSVPTAPKEAELRERERALEEKLKQLEARERRLDSRDADAPASPSASVASSQEEMVSIVNNGRRAIGVPGGFALYPGLNTVPRRAWARMFDATGKPTPGASEHLDSQNGQRPEVQEVSLKNLSQLPDEHAQTAISASEDVKRLALFEQTEARPHIRVAISERLKVLKAKDSAKK